MRVIALVAAFVLSGLAGLFGQNCKITGISNLEGKKVYLSIVEERLKNLDSTVVRDGKFEFRPQIKRVDAYRVRVAGTWADVSLCLEPGSEFIVEMNTSGERKYKTDYKVIKGKEQKLLDSLNVLVEAGKLAAGEDLLKGEQALAEIVEKAPAGFAKVVLADRIIYLEYELLNKAFRTLDAKYAYSSHYQLFKRKYEEVAEKWMVGKSAPEFAVKGIDGKEYRLSDFRGKYVLLDFWASWCAPCRAKTKLILEKKKELDAAGIELIAFSMDDKENLWKQASEKDGINWVNVCELVGLNKSNTALSYKVTNLPTLFLIAPDGTIVKQNPSLDEVIAIGKAPRDGGRIVLKNANVVDVERGEVLPGHDLYIENGVIQAVVPAGRGVLAAGREVDLSGKYVMPGLIDAHVHWANFAQDRPAMDSLAAAFSRDGITTVRDMAGDGEVCKKYIGYLQEGSLKGPALYYCSMWAGEEYFKVMESQGRPMEHDAAWELMVTDTTSFAEKARRAKEYGCTGLKLYHDFTKPELDAIYKEAMKNGLHVWCHFATPPASPLEVVLSGAETVSHIYLIEEVPNKANVNNEQARQARLAVFKEMSKRGTLLDPTLLLSVKNGMAHNIEYVKEAVACGVELVAGTDYIDISPEGSYVSFLLDELDLYVKECGIPIKDVIRYVTLNGAKALGMNGRIGVIKAGARADLLILDKSPYEGLETLRKSSIFNPLN